MSTTFYRCVTCRGVVSQFDIAYHRACPKCGGTRVKPTNLGWLEKAAQIFKHPRVWAWPNE